MKRITYLAAAGALVATSGLGAYAASAATADSPSAQVRTAARHGADDPAGITAITAPTTGPVTTVTTAPTTVPVTTVTTGASRAG